MAPDLNMLSNGNGKIDYSTPGSSGYYVPDINLNVSPMQGMNHEIRCAEET